MIFYHYTKDFFSPTLLQDEEQRKKYVQSVFSSENLILDDVYLYGQDTGKELNLYLADTLCHSLEDISYIAKLFLNNLSPEKEEVKLEEITLQDFIRRLHVLSTRDNRSFQDVDAVLLQLNLVQIAKSVGKSYKESLFKEELSLNSSTAISRCKSGFLDDSVLNEIERVYAGRNPLTSIVHPCHYLVITDNKEEREEILQLLCSSLRSQGRLLSRRRGDAILSYEGNEASDCRLGFIRRAMEAMEENFKGGTLVLDVSVADTEESSEEVFVSSLVADDVTESLLNGRRSVLTILTMDNSTYKTAKDYLQEKLGKMNFIPLFGKRFQKEDGEQFFFIKAMELGGEMDLLAFQNSLEEGVFYTRQELEVYFSSWLDRHLVEDVFPSYKSILKTQKEEEKKEDYSKSYRKLQKMIGLGKAKEIIDEAIAFNKMQVHYSAIGLKKKTISRHMVFTGNPGTAKTTVARLFAKIMKDKGILQNGRLVEVGRADLVGKYVGQTAPRVKEAFRKATGSVLFIDEAYSLLEDRKGLYGEEAINTIVQEMENHRSDVIVIFAGYPDRMEHFLESNPGLRSRISFIVPFEDYSAKELREILTLMFEDDGMSITDHSEARLSTILEEAVSHPNFGNGRFVRNLYEHALMRQSARLSSENKDCYSKKELTTFLPDDFEMPVKLAKTEPQIGFCLN